MHITQATRIDDWQCRIHPSGSPERTLQLAIEVCLDLADHVIADHRLPVPETAAGAFDALRDAKLLTPELAAALVRMARFRNLLVHDYVRIDAGRVFDIATNDVADLERFSEVVSGLV